MRLTGSDVMIERRGKAIAVTPASEHDSWSGFWEAFEPVEGDALIRRWPICPSPRRASL
jgi:hypothetical protein